MKTVSSFLLIAILSMGKLMAQPTFDYEANKQMLIERALMQYMMLLHHDRYDVTHLDGFCAERAKGADLAALREVAKVVPEEFNWTNKDSKTITGTAFKVGSVFTVELASTDGRTAVVQFIVSGSDAKPMLVVYDHLKLTS